MRRRNNHISLWLDDKEMKNLKNQTEKTGQKYSQVIRNLIRTKKLELPAILLKQTEAHNGDYKNQSGQ